MINYKNYKVKAYRITYLVIGSSRRNIPLVEARREDGTVVSLEDGKGNVGVGTAPFYLVFGEDWFADGEVLFGNLNEVYPIRVLGDARMEGTNAVYRCELMGGITDGIPAERLLQGERFSHEYAPVERELSRRKLIAAYHSNMVVKVGKNGRPLL